MKHMAHTHAPHSPQRSRQAPDSSRCRWPPEVSSWSVRGRAALPTALTTCTRLKSLSVDARSAIMGCERASRSQHRSLQTPRSCIDRLTTVAVAWAARHRGGVWVCVLQTRRNTAASCRACNSMRRAPGFCERVCTRTRTRARTHARALALARYNIMGLALQPTSEFGGRR